VAQANPRCTSGLRSRGMLAAMLGVGLRVSEIVALMPRDVDLEQGIIRVNLGKGGRDRVVPVDQETAGWLQAWAEKRRALKLDGRRRFFCAIRRTSLGSEPGRPLAIRTVQNCRRRLQRWLQSSSPTSADRPREAGLPNGGAEVQVRAGRAPKPTKCSG